MVFSSQGCCERGSPVVQSCWLPFGYPSNFATARIQNAVTQRHHIDGKSSSPNTYSSSSESLSSGKRPFLRKKLFASRIMGSRIFSGKTPLSEFVSTIPEHTSFAVLLTSPPKFARTAFSHSSHTSSPCLASGTPC